MSIDRRIAIKSALLALSSLGAACGNGGGEEATAAPTPAPGPGPAPTSGPTTAPTSAPTASPTAAPTAAPTPAPTPAPGGALVSALTFDAQTPEHINIYVRPNRTAASGTTATVRYRVAGSTSWIAAHPLIRIDPTVLSGDPKGETIVDAFAGVIFDLTPGTNYDVEVTFTEPSATPVVVSAQRATRALPGPAGTVTKNVSPTGNLQATLNSLVPGDVLLLANGTYNVSNLVLNVQGSASNPIYIRGASRSGVIIRDTSDAVLTIGNASHIVLEDLTLQGSGVDSGTAASSMGVLYGSSGSFTPTNITLRRLTLTGIDQGIVSYAGLNGWLIYHCTLNGNNTWDKSYTVPPGDTYASLTWNDDGIRLPGKGNCAFENTLNGFGDAFASAVSPSYPVATQAIHFYRNKVVMTGDDAWEADYGQRNISFYDNYIGNSGTFFSADPVFGGPAYCFRNISINTWRGPFKWNDDNYGLLVYNNTIIKTGNTLGGLEGWLWNQYNNGWQIGWSFRNNLLYKSGSSVNANILFFEAVGSTKLDFTHNGWYPDGNFLWRDASGTDAFSSVAAARAGLPNLPTFLTSAQRHTADIALPADVFDPPITLTTHTVQYTALALPTLRAGTSARASGTVIPGITDGHSGAAPDRGAIISGRPSVVHGDPTPP